LRISRNQETDTAFRRVNFTGVQAAEFTILHEIQHLMGERDEGVANSRAFIQHDALRLGTL